MNLKFIFFVMQIQICPKRCINKILPVLLLISFLLKFSSLISTSLPSPWFFIKPKFLSLFSLSGVIGTGSQSSSKVGAGGPMSLGVSSVISSVRGSSFAAFCNSSSIWAGWRSISQKNREFFNFKYIINCILKI